MAVQDVENDIELAVKAVLTAQLATDGITGVSIDNLTSGSPGDVPVKPYVFIACRPLMHMGAGLDQWSGDLSIQIMTKHLEGKDADAATLVDIMGSVSYALDYGNFSAQTTRLNSIALRRTGGDYQFEESENMVNLDVEIIKACGSK